MKGKDILAATFPTAWGYVGILATEAGVAAITLPVKSEAAVNRALGRFRMGQSGCQMRESELDTHMKTLTRAAQILERAETQVREYLAGRRRAFHLPLDPITGTPFARAVWQACAEIPYGQTRSYGWIAERIGRPRAARAVGTALGANPLPLVIPCHRVVRSTGGLGGFGGGIVMKKRLLALERSNVCSTAEKMRGE